jgi:hypothetical protein
MHVFSRILNRTDGAMQADSVNTTAALKDQKRCAVGGALVASIGPSLAARHLFEHTKLLEMYRELAVTVQVQPGSELHAYS